MVAGVGRGRGSRLHRMLASRGVTGPTPPRRLQLAHLPTPLQPSARLGAELGIELLWKRDDLSGLELSGNKARKLEFLLADLLDNPSWRANAGAFAAKYTAFDQQAVTGNLVRRIGEMLDGPTASKGMP